MENRFDVIVNVNEVDEVYCFGVAEELKERIKAEALASAQTEDADAYVFTEHSDREAMEYNF